MKLLEVRLNQCDLCEQEKSVFGFGTVFRCPTTMIKWREGTWVGDQENWWNKYRWSCRRPFSSGVGEMLWKVKRKRCSF